MLDVIQTTTAVIDNVLDHLSSTPGPSKISYAYADAIAYFSAWLLCESIISCLASWTPQCCPNMRTARGRSCELGVQIWNDTSDGLMHDLRAVDAYLGKRKEKDTSRREMWGSSAERLTPELMVPLTRLDELVSPFVVVVQRSTFKAQLIFFDCRHKLTVASFLFRSLGDPTSVERVT